MPDQKTQKMHILRFSLVIALSILTGGPALACKCFIPTKSPTELANDGWVVLKGVAVSEDTSSPPTSIISYRFKVSHAINSKLRGEIMLKSQSSAAVCGGRLEVGVVSVFMLHRGVASAFMLQRAELGEYWFNFCSQIAVNQDLDGWNAILDASQ